MDLVLHSLVAFLSSPSLVHRRRLLPKQRNFYADLVNNPPKLSTFPGDDLTKQQIQAAGGTTTLTCR